MSVVSAASCPIDSGSDISDEQPLRPGHYAERRSSAVAACPYALRAANDVMCSPSPQVRRTYHRYDAELQLNRLGLGLPSLRWILHKLAVALYSLSTVIPDTPHHTQRLQSCHLLITQRTHPLHLALCLAPLARLIPLALSRHPLTKCQPIHRLVAIGG